MTGELVAQRIVEAYALAAVDPYRAATHNKGIMNGVDAVVMATGNDWRAIEAGAHAYAARDGLYRSLSTWSYAPRDSDGGRRQRWSAASSCRWRSASSAAPPGCIRWRASRCNSWASRRARELAEIIAAVGLAQNLAAIRALATEGIQKGHMALHARQVAIAAGAQTDEVDAVSAALVAETPDPGRPGARKFWRKCAQQKS